MTERLTEQGRRVLISRLNRHEARITELEDRVRELETISGEFLEWFDKRFPEGERVLLGLPQYRLAERLRAALRTDHPQEDCDG